MTGSNETITLFHGTSSSRGGRIATGGFQPPDLQAEIVAVAERFGVDADELRDDLKRHNRYTQLRGDDQLIYATTDRNHAESYASRAPEVEWECLWAVFRVRHPETGAEWNQNDVGNFWVTSTLAKDPPVVLELSVALSALAGVNRPELLKQISYPKRERDSGREVRIPSDARVEHVARHEADRLVDGSLLRHMAGLTPDEIAAEVKRGLWGTPQQYRSMWYWPWRGVVARLSAARRAELGL